MVTADESTRNLRYALVKWHSGCVSHPNTICSMDELEDWCGKGGKPHKHVFVGKRSLSVNK